MQMPADDVRVVQAEAGRVELPRYQPLRILEGVPIVRSAGAEGGHEADPETPPGPSYALDVVRGHRRGVPEDHGHERADVHAQLEGRGANEHVQAPFLER